MFHAEKHKLVPAGFLKPCICDKCWHVNCQSKRQLLYESNQESSWKLITNLL